MSSNHACCSMLGNSSVLASIFYILVLKNLCYFLYFSHKFVTHKQPSSASFSGPGSISVELEISSCNAVLATLKLLLQQLILYIKTNTNFILFNNFIQHIFIQYIQYISTFYSKQCLLVCPIFSILGRRFRRIQYHELERMFGRLFLFPFSLQRFCNDS